MKSRTINDWSLVPVVVDIEYAAGVLGYSAEYLKKKARRQDFPAFKCLNSWRITKADLMRLCGEVDK